MKLYRIEDRDGYGPFRNFGRLDAWSNIMEGMGRSVRDFPGPHNDAGIGRRFLSGHHRIAVRSKAALHRWFPAAAFRLFAKAAAYCGFAVKTIEVPDADVIVGEHQVVFDPAHAKVIASEPIT